ncbi:hypothetical protein ACV229_36895 [Burkholderia sp. MR1-5-21]
MNNRKEPFPCRRVGKVDGKSYFFGYYNKSNWDATGRYLLGHQVPWRDKLLEPNLDCVVGYFDLNDGDRFVEFGKTTAWNWQMGSQLQWLAGDQRRAIFNVRTDHADTPYPFFGSAICDVESGATRQLPLPIYSVAPNAKWALSVDYRRLYVTHETIGYSCDRHAPKLENCPAGDGIRWMDLESGDNCLLVSYRQLRDFHPRASMEKAIHWVSHIEINPSSERILFLHRWTERVEDETCFLHRLITINPDGTDMRLLECSDHPLPQLTDDFYPNSVGTFDYEKSEYQISHPLWRDNGEIIVWGPHDGEIHYHLYQDSDAGSVKVVGRGILAENGHMTFSRANPRWMLSDTYPNSETHERTLFLFDIDSETKYDLGDFYADPKLSKENRCDLHPRWSPNGLQACVDSIHEHDRAMYLIDVSRLTGR